jgi:UDP-galactopyranose mutase
MKCLIVGAGLSGLTVARILRDAGHKVFVLEKRHYLGGTCADYAHDGYFINLHGPHLFHTDDERVWKFLSRFTDWLPYQHRVNAVTDKGIIPLPFNDVSASIVGDLDEKGIVDLLFRGYSRKMWGIEWEQIPESATSRVSRRRQGADCRYFTSRYEGIPKAGYSSMFLRMAEGIDVALGVNENEWKSWRDKFDRVVYCGRPDALFDYAHGRLRFRSLRFSMEWGKSRPGEACVLNNCTAIGPTRTTDYASMYGMRRETVPLISEYPCEADEMEPYYPMWDVDLFGSLRRLAETDGIEFLGRVATYTYIDMNQSVQRALLAGSK